MSLGFLLGFLAGLAGGALATIIAVIVIGSRDSFDIHDDPDWPVSS